MKGAARIATAVSGIVAVVLIFAGQGVMVIGARTEPAFDGTTDEIAAFLSSLRPGSTTAGSLIVLLGAAALLWFVAGLPGWLVPGPDDGGPALLAVRAAQLSTVAFVATVVTGGWQLAVLRAGDVDPAIARLIFDEGSLDFANSWVMMGAFAIGAGVAMLAGRRAPGWLGWWAVLAGIGMVVARAVWLTEFWLLPYALVWLWIITASIVLLRHRTPAQVQEAARS
jgi:hypothetical protein